nr:TonB-dependent receptor [Brevundimonas naejangsanensis]
MSSSFISLRNGRRAVLAAVAATLAVSLSAPSAFAQDAEHHDDEQEHGHDEATEVEDIIVQATRSGRRIQDEPIRVEVIGREEIEEKLLMTPGNIAMLVNETGGVRVQVTSPALGAANIRMQGMSGRYTQLLADGLPLYGGQASSLGVLQIPPTDLGQVEVIKGAASALYGPSALGGVINLVSRRPGDEVEAEVLANITSRDGQDLTAYASAPFKGAWGQSIVGGYNRQSRQDLDGDGWSDIAAYERWSVRPRLFWEGDNGGDAFVTVGAMTETRSGGTEPGRTAPDGRPFVQAQDTDRFDAGLVARLPVAWGTAHIRASAMTQAHDHQFGDVFEQDRHDTGFLETSLGSEVGATTWLAGAAVQVDAYRSETFSGFDYTYTVPGVFAQVEHELTPDLTLAGSARFDQHSEYGGQFSPRLSMLYRPGPWTVRASVGQGFFAPTPFVDVTEATGLSRLEPLDGLKEEVARTASLDVGYRRGRIEANLTLFGSDLDDAIRAVNDGMDRVRLINVESVTRTRGAEALLRYRQAPFTLTGSYVFVDATEPDDNGFARRDTPVTPRHTAGLVAMWEEHDRGRLGLEIYYTGKQTLEDSPYRSESPSYVEVGLLGEVIFGRVSLFLNAENLLNVRQTRHDPLLLPQRAADGRWTVDAWGPTDGFTVNGGARLRFGGRH